MHYTLSADYYMTGFSLTYGGTESAVLLVGMTFYIYAHASSGCMWSQSALLRGHFEVVPQR